MSDNSTDPPVYWGIAGNSTCIDPSSPEAVWPFCPNLGAAIFFLTIFAILTITHTVQAVIYRKAFSWVIIMGAAWELAGLAARITSIQHNISLGLYAAQTALILLAPLWINAYLYMVFGRMVLYFSRDARIWRLKARHISWMFILSDIVMLLVQLAGVGFLTSNDAGSVNTGKIIYMAGLGVQIFSLTAFIALVIAFYVQMKANGNRRQENWHHATRLIIVTYILFVVRIVYRMIEYNDGFDGPVPTHEVYYYVFDALLMAACIMLWSIYHPGHILRGPDSKFPSRKERRRLKQQEETLHSDTSQSNSKTDNAAIRMEPSKDDHRRKSNYSISCPQMVDPNCIGSRGSTAYASIMPEYSDGGEQHTLLYSRRS